MFLQIVQRDRVEALAEAVTREWQRAQDDWIAEGDIQLYPELQKLLTRAVCGWAGVPLPATEVEARSRQLSALFDEAGPIGVGPLRSRAARRTAASWTATLIAQNRAGQLELSSLSSASL